jgi:capsular exopolysaccharide synthesis family protein
MLPLCIVRHFDRLSVQAECYRGLRTALELVGQSSPFRTLMVTSAGAQEGKTTTLVNLAVLFWEMGRRVLLVDSDLRRGCLHRVFGVPRSPGLTDLILGKADTLFPAHELKPGFSLMTRGVSYDKPGVLLGSPAFRQALTLFASRADIVLLDSSPLLPVSDTLKLVSGVDGVLVVVRAGTTQRRDAARARKLLESARANVLGVVVNGIQDHPLTSRTPYYAYEEDPDMDVDPLPHEWTQSAADLDRFS